MSTPASNPFDHFAEILDEAVFALHNGQIATPATYYRADGSRPQPTTNVIDMAIRALDEPLQDFRRHGGRGRELIEALVQLVAAAGPVSQQVRLSDEETVVAPEYLQRRIMKSVVPRLGRAMRTALQEAAVAVKNDSMHSHASRLACQNLALEIGHSFGWPRGGMSDFSKAGQRFRARQQAKQLPYRPAHPALAIGYVPA